MHWWAGQIDVCINLFTSFGYFEAEADNQEVLREVGRVLRPGGEFLLDISNRDYSLLQWWPRTWRRHGKAIIREETDLDPRPCRFRMTFTWIEGQRQESLTHSVRHYTAPELTGMLRTAGLGPTAVYGDFDGGAFDLYSKRLIVVAKKE
jgi:SAM-dependent methyltransferase